jgi:hypothetical protein
MKPTQPSRRLGAFLALLFLVVSVEGCGGKGLYQVHGTVEFKDGSDVEVLEGGLVTFQPADLDAPVKSSARGEIKKDGSFVMSTYSEGDGVLPGRYRVMVAPPPFFAKARGQTAPQLMDEKYQSFSTSGLEITVDKAMTDYTITVQKP